MNDAHLNEGEIRAYLDHELGDVRQAQAAQHLASCTRCQSLAQRMQDRGLRVEAHLTRLSPVSPIPTRTAAAARAQLEARRQTLEKEHESMFSKWFSRKARPAWALLAVIALLSVSMAFPSVRALANNFLGLFRVQRVTVVPFDDTVLSSQLGNSSAQLEYIFTNDFKEEYSGEAQDVTSVEEASALVGFPVRLPSEVDEAIEMMYQPGFRMSFDLNLDRVHAVLDEIGRSDVRLPQAADGANISLETSGQLMVRWGDCAYVPNRRERPQCNTLVQLQSPIVTAPPDLDMQALGAALFQVLGKSPQQAAELAASIDWTTTLVLPLPQNDATYTTVEVDGVEGLLITQHGYSPNSYYNLFWVKDGITYNLTGTSASFEARKIADSLR